jgi:hypothetical protein
VSLAAWLAILWAGSTTLAAAQPPGPDSGPRSRDPGEALTVTLVTFEPGEKIYERYGHNAIWIHDAGSGADELYDWGRFSFSKPHFLLRFIQGQMWYAMGFERDVPAVVAFYVGQGRKVWMQELDLPPGERLRLREFLAWNYLPENREYAYDYYLDNCSTRVRDALDRALGGAIRRFGDTLSGWTWRDETRRLNQHNRGLYTGLLLVLGQPVDREMTRWEQMFLPMRLREDLNRITRIGADGIARPVVRWERLVAAGGQWPVPDRPGNWLPGYIVLGLLLGGLMVLAARTRGFLPLATLWMLLVGLLGGFMMWAWMFSYHRAAYANENLFLWNLLALALALVLPSALRGRSWAVKPARRLAGLVAGVGGLGLAVKVLPWFPQHNLEIIALILPTHLAVWVGTLRVTSDR